MQHYSGLSTSEIVNLRSRFGDNELAAPEHVSIFSRLYSQFKSVLILLLVLAAIISLAAGETLDAIFIMIIVIINGALGFYQEYKAEKAVAALRTMTVSISRVIRDGIEISLPSKELLPGDIVLIDEGSFIPADGIVLESALLEVNESALTGESQSVVKSAKINDELLEENQVFLGTHATRGHGVMQVAAIGKHTKFGSITQLLSELHEDPTPLQEQLTALGKWISLLAGICCVILFCIGLVRGFDIFTIFLTAVSLAVAAIPEGLPAIVTITLGLGVSRMASRKTVVRRLASIETLGATQIICTDKTGTLTTNSMIVRTFSKIADGVTESEIARAVSLCNTASLIQDSQGEVTTAGDSTEGALLKWVDSIGETYEVIRSESPIEFEIPFDSAKKYMTVFVKEGSGYAAYTKGAPEVILEQTTLPASRIAEVNQQVTKMAEQGLRVIAVGRHQLSLEDWSATSMKDKERYSHTEILALFGIADPPRKDVAEAIARAREAGVETIMITGDNPVTAGAIGKEIGLLRPGEEIITGDQLHSMSDDELSSHLAKVRIFSRTTPEDKLRIVSFLQKSGYIVASTGDGVNDALALKKANIGISMGITGTDVAKEASDMILLDDHYATLVAAIEEGRRIYGNIVNAVYYLLACNLSEVLVIACAILLFPSTQLPFVAVQLLWINLITDGMPALALAVDPLNKQDFLKGPRKKNAYIIQPHDIPWLALIAIGCAVLTLIAFWYGLENGGIYIGRSYAFVTMVAAQCVSLLLIRRTSPLNNPFLFIVIIGTVLLQLLVVSLPFTQTLFELR